MTAVNNLSSFVDAEGRELQARMVRVSPTSVKVTWTPPKEPKAYNGVIVVASPLELNASNFPSDGVRYEASADINVVADRIGLAQVVGAFYDDLTTKEMTITGLETNTAIYVAVHLVTNVYGYYTEGNRSYAETEESVAFAGRIEDSSSPPLDPTPGQVYYDTVQNMTFAWDGAAWMPVTAHTTLTGENDPAPPFDGMPQGYPAVGAFFYNTRERVLKAWSGHVWVVSEPEKGVPTYNKLGIGTTGESTARSNIKAILRAQLGYPQICVELTEFQFDIALNNALQEFRRRTDTAYYKQYFFMQMIPAQQTYYLNDPTKGLDKIVDVIKIHRLNTFGLINNGPNNIFAQQFLNQFYAPGQGFDLVAIHLISSLAETYRLIFAGDVAFSWREATRELTTYRRFNNYEKVLVECSMEKPEQELLVDRWAQQWIQQWAEAELMFMLSHIRGKFANLPGPNGGLSLNAADLMSEGTRLQEDCLRQIKDYEVGQFGGDHFYSPIVIG